MALPPVLRCGAINRVYVTLPPKTTRSLQESVITVSLRHNVTSKLIYKTSLNSSQGMFLANDLSCSFSLLSQSLTN